MDLQAQVPKKSKDHSRKTLLLFKQFHIICHRLKQTTMKIDLVRIHRQCQDLVSLTCDKLLDTSSAVIALWDTGVKGVGVGGKAPGSEEEEEVVVETPRKERR